MDYQFVPTLVVAFTMSLGLTPVSRQVAMRLGVMDTPKIRNITKLPTPMMGGLPICLSFTVSMILFSAANLFTELLAILSGAVLLAIIGLLDDRYNLGIRIRLVVMAVSSCILIVTGIHISLFDNPLIDYPLTIFWIVAITNAVNFLDNMDGLAAGLSAIAGVFFMMIGIIEELPLVTGVASALLGSTLGFLVFNFNPASMFMGDMGALPLGFILATLGIILKFGAQPVGVSWMVPVLVLALPIFDINLVVFTRILEGRSPGEAGKDHTSHRLMSLGLGQRPTIIVLYCACIFFGMVGLAMGNMSTEWAWFVGMMSIALLGLLFWTMMWIRRKFQLYQG